MNPTLRIVLAIVVGIIVSFIVNMGLIILGSILIPPPEGLDLTDMETLKSVAATLDAKYFIFPFLAHALGVLVGGYVGARIAPQKAMLVAGVVAGMSLLGGIMNAFQIPAPTWFLVVDLALAYIPMGWLAATLVKRSVK
jgi:hypothetical protein